MAVTNKFKFSVLRFQTILDLVIPDHFRSSEMALVENNNNPGSVRLVLDELFFNKSISYGF